MLPLTIQYAVFHFLMSFPLGCFICESMPFEGANQYVTYPYVRLRK
jgi:hypothetical protein